MSANKTGVLSNWLIIITVIFALLLIVIIFVLANIRELSLETKIKYGIQALATTAIIFLGLALIVNAYYGAKRAQALHKSAIAAEKNIELSIQNAKLSQDKLIAERNIELSIQNAKLSQDKLIAERFMTAIAQLGHEKTETRTGAIYALERVAQEFPTEHWTIMEILTAFVRENAPVYEGEPATQEDAAPIDFAQHKSENHRTQQLNLNFEEQSSKIRTDIQVALTVIGRRNYLEDRENQQINLRNTNIRRADLLGANLERVDFRGSDLCGADLRGAALAGADLSGARLSGSILYEANLLKANLRGADLCWANLNRANLSGANLRGANLTGASPQSS